MDSKNYLDLVRQMYAHPKTLWFIFSEEENLGRIASFSGLIEGILDRRRKKRADKGAYLMSKQCGLWQNEHAPAQISARICVRAPIVQLAFFRRNHVLRGAGRSFHRRRQKRRRADAQGVISLSPQYF
jgi:hypothetical protein